MNGSHDDLRDSAGAWVLGALDDEEAYGFAAHLEVCATCRAEVARLQVAADALPLAAPPVEPPPELRDRIMAVVESEARDVAQQEQAHATTPSSLQPRPARRRRWPRIALGPALAAAAACALLVVGGVAGFVLRGGGPQTHVVQASVDRGKATGARAQLVQTGGSAVLRVWNMPSPPAGHVYEVWVERPGNAAPTPDNVFTVDRSGRGSVAIRNDVRDASAVLVTDEPDGGSMAPTGRQVLVARPA